jgi:hypothetical protein
MEHNAKNALMSVYITLYTSNIISIWILYSYNICLTLRSSEYFILTFDWLKICSPSSEQFYFYIINYVLMSAI